MICHELFHVLSRHDPDLREELYNAIGFKKCGEVELPPELSLRKITNPDAPKNDHCIRIKVDDAEHWAIPILISKTEKYDAEKGGEFFQYVQLRFLLVDRHEGQPSAELIRVGDGVRQVDIRQVSEFFTQVGRNTSYIIHPEEILAENFAFLVLRKPNLNSPEIVERMEETLERYSTDNEFETSVTE